MPKKTIILILFLALLPHSWAQSSQPARAPNAAAILAEVGQSKTQLEALKLSAGEAENVASLLNRSERAAQAGYTFLGLHLLQYAKPLLTAYTYVKAQTAKGKMALPAFEQEWRRLGPELSAQQRQFRLMPKLPVAVQAIWERALTQVQPNYQASLLYGQEAGIENGLFYMGLAQGQLEFLTFCRTLKFAAPAASPLPPPAAELAATEADVLAAYQKLDSPEQHTAFIRVNSALKVAQDLAQEQRSKGVWLQVLEARRSLTAILVTTTENRAATDLRAHSETVRAQLAKANTDQSLGWLYWQLAETALATNDLKSANAILHHVLPRYFQAQRNKR
jgi:hypothetical protein